MMVVSMRRLACVSRRGAATAMLGLRSPPSAAAATPSSARRTFKSGASTAAAASPQQQEQEQPEVTKRVPLAQVDMDSLRNVAVASSSATSAADAGVNKELSHDFETTPEGVVVLDYNQLLDGTANFGPAIEHAYGYDGVGLLVVRGVPGLAEKRADLLPLGRAFAELPDDVKAKSELAEANYSFGWSHGKEKLTNGDYDTFKGSYYNNPQYDEPVSDPSLVAKYPHSCHPNIWPEDDLPALKPAFKNLGQLIVEVGQLVARECDKHVASKLPTYAPGTLERAIGESKTCKARLLYYYPLEKADAAVERSTESWCGWHNDHGALTGLTPAMFIDTATDTQDIKCPDPQAGLYAHTRTGQVVQVKIPPGQIAFQIGECSQVLTGGILRATPHAVRAIDDEFAEGVGRSTFAVFMQPDNEVELEVPSGVELDAVAVGQYRPGQQFIDFHKATFESTA